MYNNKYMLIIHGSNRAELVNKAFNLVGNAVQHSVTINCDIFINQVYDTGVPDELVWDGKRAIQLHGIVLPNEQTLDEFASEPITYLRRTLIDYKGRYNEVGKAFRNGSFAGIVLDEDTDELYAFTCFLNTIPLYYCVEDGCIIVSSDYYLIASLTGSTLDDMHPGLIEYYIHGLNISDNSVLPRIKHLGPGTYLRYKNSSIKTDLYFCLSKEDPSRSFTECLDEFSEKWESNILGMSSSKFKYGLGLTGGFDSRIILAALRNPEDAVLFTGPGEFHPDYILANHLSRKLGLKNHVLEDHASGDFLKGFSDFCTIADNPTLSNYFNYRQQLDFRASNGLAYELRGGTEFIGGCSYFTKRYTLLYSLKKALPIIKHKFRGDIEHFRELVAYSIGNGFANDVIDINKSSYESYLDNFEQASNNIVKQINPNGSQEAFLERFRCIYVMNTLHIGSRLGGRRICELLAPGIGIELMEVASRIPLKYKENRKLIIAYLKTRHPELSKTVTRGSIFPPSYPWILFKTTFPFVNDLNAIGIKIPLIQWYMKKEHLRRKHDYREQHNLQRIVCADSPFVRDTWLERTINEHPDDNARLMRIYNLALLQKRLQLGEEGLKQYLADKVEHVRLNSIRV